MLSRLMNAIQTRRILLESRLEERRATRTIGGGNENPEEYPKPVEESAQPAVEENKKELEV